MYTQFLKNIYLLIYFWLCRVLLEAHGIFCCGAWALCCGTQDPERVGSVVAAHGLSSCGPQAPQLWHTGPVAPQHVGS